MNYEIILEFLTQHYREIIDISVLIISVVICLIRKRPSFNQIDTIKKDALDTLPLFISSVEIPGNGEKKKQAVIDLLSAYLRKKYHFDITDEMINYFGSAIESILSTPQKK